MHALKCDQKIVDALVENAENRTAAITFFIYLFRFSAKSQRNERLNGRDSERTNERRKKETEQRKKNIDGA